MSRTIKLELELPDDLVELHLSELKELEENPDLDAYMAAVVEGWLADSEWNERGIPQDKVQVKVRAVPRPPALKLADLEIAWWQGHHRKDAAKVLESLTEQFIAMFNIPRADAMKAAKLKLAAGREHDEAEALEDKGQHPASEDHWNNARLFLREHFKILTQEKSLENNA